MSEPVPQPGPDVPSESVTPPSGEAEEASGPNTSGHPRVDEALRMLDEHDGLPPAEQVPGYEAAHRTLQESLATIDEGQS